MTGTFDLVLVAVSYAISVFGSYTGLVLAGQITDLRNAMDRMWLAFAAVALGGGAIWSMHFIGMLAYQPPIPVSYDATLTVLSLVLAVLFVGLGVYRVIRQRRMKFSTLGGSGIIMGLGVAAMHYTGMAALQFAGDSHYDPTIVALSVVIAIVASIAALWIAFTVRTTWQKLVSAFVMGIAVCGMHYTAMYGFSMTPNADKMHIAASTIMANELAGYIVVATIAVLAVALLSVFGKELRRVGATH
jgi:NO-binding membrane sensor protein with MHYT domain